MIVRRSYVPRINTGGNYCGHTPDSPCLVIPTPFPDKLPGVIVKFTERLTEYYYNPRKKIPSLDMANGSNRQQRSERREACILLFSSIVLNIELSTMRCGIPTSDGFAPLTIKVLANRAGLSYSRAERAMKDLKKSGAIAITQITQMDDLGNFKGIPAIKKVNDIFFKLFGLGEMLKRARKAAYKRLKIKVGKNGEKQSITNVLRVKLIINGYFNSSSENKNQSNSKKPYNKGDPAKKVKAQAELLDKLKTEHPAWDDRQIINKAKQLSMVD